MTFPFARERGYFPIVNEKIQLSSCSQSALSMQVQEAIAAYVDTLRYTGMDWNLWMDKVEEAKGQFARLINASREEIAVLSSVSDCASSVATALDFSGSAIRSSRPKWIFPALVTCGWPSRNEAHRCSLFHRQILLYR